MLTFIPQLFYDFLARIVPSAVIVVVSTFVIFGFTNVAEFVLNPSKNIKLFTATPFLLVILGSYLIGFIFGELWEMTIARFTRKKRNQIEEKCKQKCLEEHNHLQKVLGLSELKVKTGDLPRAFVMRNHLRHVMPSEALRLLKIRAERRLCHVLIFGFLVLGIINVGYLLSQPTTERIVLEILLIIVVAVCWSRTWRQLRQFVNGITVSWLIQASSGQILTHKRTVKNG